MLKTIRDKVLEHIVEITFPSVIFVVGYIVRNNATICQNIVSKFSACPRMTVMVMVCGLLVWGLVVYLLCKRYKTIKTECCNIKEKLKSLEDPMRNLELEVGTSIYKDTEQDRFICPKCFAKNYMRSYLEREKNSNYQYEAYTYSCHVCDFKTYDITQMDKLEAENKHASVEARRNTMYSEGVFML